MSISDMVFKTLPCQKGRVLFLSRWLLKLSIVYSSETVRSVKLRDVCRGQVVSRAAYRAVVQQWHCLWSLLSRELCCMNPQYLLRDIFYHLTKRFCGCKGNCGCMAGLLLAVFMCVVYGQQSKKDQLVS